MKRSDAGLLLFILGFGFFLQFPQIDYGEPVVRDPDSVYTVEAARGLAEEWKAGRFVLDTKSYFYPAGYTNLLAVTAVLTGTNRLQEKARAVSILAMLLAAVAAFLIGARIKNVAAGLVSAALVSWGALFFRQGIRPAPDSLQLLFVALGVFFLVRRRELDAKDALWSGLWSGAAVGTKYLGIISVLPVLFVLLYREAKNRNTAFAVRLFVLWPVGALAGFFAVSPQFFFHADEFVRHLFLQRQIQQLGGLNPIGKGPWDMLFYQGTNFLEFPFAASVSGLMGWPFVIAGVIALPWALVQGWVKKDFRLVGLAGSCVVTFAYFSFSSQTLGMRYLLPWGLLVSVLIAVMITDNRKPWATLAAACVILLPNIARAAHYVILLSKEDSRMICVKWMAGNIRPGAKILNFMYGPALPAKLYTSVQWTFPEYVYELPTAAGKGPSFRKLREEAVDCVVWNNFYTDKFIRGSVSPDQAPYLAEWRRFHADLNRLSGRKQTFFVEDGLGPQIEIFCGPFAPFEKTS